MHVTRTIEIDAPAAVVWQVLHDVERWPRWTSSITSAALEQGSGLEPGAVVRLKQPRLAAMRWTVTDVVAGHRFTWTTRSPGLTAVAAHEVTDLGGARAAVVLDLTQSGPLAGVVGRLYARRTRRYLDLEAEGLKAAAEAAAQRT